MKAKREHCIPLTSAALAILVDVARLRLTDAPDAFVFPSRQPGKGLSNMTMTAVLRRMKRGDLTVHGLRHASGDWAAELTSYPGELSEAALARVVGDKVQPAYRRGDLFDKRAT